MYDCVINKLKIINCCFINLNNRCDFSFIYRLVLVKKNAFRFNTLIMDRFRHFNSIALGILVLLVGIISQVNGQADDFPGPYCATRPGGCCKDRKDACSVPISSKSIRFVMNAKWLI